MVECERSERIETTRRRGNPPLHVTLSAAKGLPRSVGDSSLLGLDTSREKHAGYSTSGRSE